MKKNFMYAMMSAIALAGTVGFTSCAGNEEVAEVNPGYNPETGEVPVNFVFNVSTGNTATTRMSEATTQVLSTSTFRGMDESNLMSFKLDEDGKHIVTTTQGADKAYALGSVLGVGAIGPNSETKSHRVLELAVPIGTNAMMFWGKAKKTGTNKEQGKITYNVSKTIGNNSFGLCPILPEGDTRTEFQQYQKLLAKIINNIMQISVSYDVDYESTNYHGTLKWSDFASITYETPEGSNESIKRVVAKTTAPNSSEELCALGEILASSYAKFCSIGDNELRAGSGTAVERMLVDLYDVIDHVAAANPTTPQEAVVKEVGEGIKNEMKKYLNDSYTTWASFKNLVTNSGIADADKTKLPSTSTDNLMKLFPGNFDMPDGSTVLLCEVTANDADNTIIDKVTFSYRQTIPAYNMDGTNVYPDGFNIFNYMYPAELCYFGNSPIRVTSDSHKAEEFPEGTTEWNNEDSWKAGATYGTDNKSRNNTVDWTKNGRVLTSTHSVAMQENVNYGTSLLKVRVRYGSDILEDNNHQLHSSETNKQITVTGNLLTLKGIIVGGQEQTVGWNYIVNAENPAFNNMIYDGALSDDSKPIPTFSSTVSEASYSKPNYTLVWDNWNPSKKGDKQNVVFVALEFVNNGNDFWGENSLIPKGGTFYITAMLDPDNSLSTSDRREGVTWESNYALPPYDNSGNTIQERRVFIQDYMTDASFVIGRQSLQKAMVSVPDLRSAEMSLGLSVDLKWSAGMHFEDVILGGDDKNTQPTNTEP